MAEDIRTFDSGFAQILFLFFFFFFEKTQILFLSVPKECNQAIHALTIVPNRVKRMNKFVFR